MFIQHEITESSDEEGETIKSRTLTGAEIHHTLLNFKPEDRPITPLRDKMIYDLANSSLDFKDGNQYFTDVLLYKFHLIGFYCSVTLLMDALGKLGNFCLILTQYNWFSDVYLGTV